MRRSFLPLSLVAALAGVPDLLAQAPWRELSQPRYAWLEVDRPTLNSSPDVTGWAAFLGGRFRLGARSALVVEVPFAHGTLAGSPDSNLQVGATTRVGNPYVGFRFGTPWPSVAAELGLRVRTSRNSWYEVSRWNAWGEFSPANGEFSPANVAGNAADVERLAAFRAQQTFVLSGGFIGRAALGRGLSALAHLRIGIPVGGDYGPGDEAMLGGGLAGEYANERLHATAGVSWLGGESTQSQFGLTVGLRAGRYEPTLIVRVPTSDYALARFVVGAGVSCVLR